LPDISKIRGLIGYKPSLELPEMLEKIIITYRNKLSQPDMDKRPPIVV